MYTLKARYYNPTDGRFISRDTADVSYGNPVELNRYIYVANSPITSIDPAGFEAFSEDTLIGRVNVEEEAGLHTAFIAKAETAPLSEETITLGKDYAITARQANNTARQILWDEYGYSEIQISQKMSSVTNAYTKIDGVEYHALNSNAPKEVKDIFRALYDEDMVVIRSSEHAEVALRNFASERLGVYSNNKIAEEIKVIGVSHTGGPCFESCRLPISALGDGFLPLSYLGPISNSFASIVEALGDVAWLL